MCTSSVSDLLKYGFMQCVLRGKALSVIKCCFIYLTEISGKPNYKDNKSKLKNNAKTICTDCKQTPVKNILKLLVTTVPLKSDITELKSFLCYIFCKFVYLKFDTKGKSLENLFFVCLFSLKLGKEPLNSVEI